MGVVAVFFGSEVGERFIVVDGHEIRLTLLGRRLSMGGDQVCGAFRTRSPDEFDSPLVSSRIL